MASNPTFLQDTNFPSSSNIGVYEIKFPEGGQILEVDLHEMQRFSNDKFNRVLSTLIGGPGIIYSDDSVEVISSSSNTFSFKTTSDMICVDSLGRVFPICKTSITKSLASGVTSGTREFYLETKLVEYTSSSTTPSNYGTGSSVSLSYIKDDRFTNELTKRRVLQVTLKVRSATSLTSTFDLDSSSANTLNSIGYVPLALVSVSNSVITITKSAAVSLSLKSLPEFIDKAMESLDIADKLKSYQLISNLVTTLSSSSTNSQYPSAKLLYNELNNLYKYLGLAVEEIDLENSGTFVIDYLFKSGIYRCRYDGTADLSKITNANGETSDTSGVINVPDEHFSYADTIFIVESLGVFDWENMCRQYVLCRNGSVLTRTVSSSGSGTMTYIYSPWVVVRDEELVNRVSALESTVGDIGTILDKINGVSV